MGEEKWSHFIAQSWILLALAMILTFCIVNGIIGIVWMQISISRSCFYFLQWIFEIFTLYLKVLGFFAHIDQKLRLLNLAWVTLPVSLLVNIIALLTKRANFEANFFHSQNKSLYFYAVQPFMFSFIQWDTIQGGFFSAALRGEFFMRIFFHQGQSQYNIALSDQTTF